MKNMKMNAAQVKALFDREAVLIGTEDSVPEYRVVALFGQKAVDYVRCLGRNCPGRYFNGYGVGDFTVFILSFLGFQAAASFYNAQQIREEEEATA